MRNIVTALLLLCGVCMHAESNDSIKIPQGKDPLYFQLYGGVNKSANENLPWSEFSPHPRSGGFFVGLGEELNSVFGWRTALRYNHNKSRNVQECESQRTYGWNNLGLFFDMTLDITDALLPRSKETRRANVKAFAGVGAAYTFGFDHVPLSYRYAYSRSNQVLAGVRAGVTATYLVFDNLRAGVELSHSLFQDHFNGVKAGASFDNRTNLKIGLTYMFLPKKKMREPVILDNRLRVVPMLPFALPATESVKVRRLEGRAFLDFIVDRTEIRQDYRRNSDELKRITASIDSVLFDKTMQVRSISLHGYASPESPYSHNVSLSKGRVTAMKDYLQHHYHFDSSVFTIDNTPEDWKNLRDFIDSCDMRRRTKQDIWYENKNIIETPEAPEAVCAFREELLRVIDLDIDPDEKEMRLKQVGGGEPYRWLLKHVYPGLRHTDYVIEYVIRQYPVKEGRKLIYIHPEALSLSEMYQVANSYAAGSDEWLDALLIAAKRYPEDETANLNAACACVKVKRLADAKRYLEKAGSSSQALELAKIIKAMEGTSNWKMMNGKVELIP